MNSKNKVCRRFTKAVQLSVVFLATSLGLSSMANAVPVAKVGNVEYETIDEAMAAWSGGTTLTLLADAQMTATKTFSSTDSARTLNLSTFTLTAPAKKHAIQITKGGLTSTAYRLDITADATNPGGITTSGNSYYAIYYKNSSGKDRVGFRIYGGVFNGGAVYFQTPGNTSAGAGIIAGGTFNGTISLNRLNLTVSGGRFNGTFTASVDSTCRLYLRGGSFKTFPIQTWSADLPAKMVVGSTVGTAVTAAMINANPEAYPQFSGRYNYMNYSTNPATPMYPLDWDGNYMWQPGKVPVHDAYVYVGSDSYYYIESTNNLPSRVSSFKASVAKTDIMLGNKNTWATWLCITDAKVPLYSVNIPDAFGQTGVGHGLTIYEASDFSKTDYPGADGNTFFINRDGDVAYTGTIGFNNCYKAVKTEVGFTNVYTAVLDRERLAASVVMSGTTNNYETTAAAVAAMKKTGASVTLIFYRDSSDDVTFTTAYASTVLTVELKDGAKYTGAVSFGSRYYVVRTEDPENGRIVFTPSVKPEYASIIVSGSGETRYFEDSWDQFNAAVKSAGDGDTITVLKNLVNLNLNTGDHYEISGNVTLDLNGHSLGWSSSEGLRLTGDGTFTVVNGSVSAQYCAFYLEKGEVTLKLDNVAAKSSSTSSYYAKGPIAFAASTGCGKVIINSGTFTGSGKKNFQNATPENTMILGGTFQFDPTAMVCPGCAVTDNGDNTWTVTAAVLVTSGAEETCYASLAAAVQALKNGDRITMLQDNSEHVSLPAGIERFTFDANGKDVSAGGITPAAGYQFFVNEDGVCEYGRLTAVVGLSTYLSFSEAMEAVEDGGLVKLIADLSGERCLDRPITFDFGTNVFSGTILVMTNATLSGTKGGMSVNAKAIEVEDGCTVTVVDGRYTVAEGGPLFTGEGKVVVQGGTFNFDPSLYVGEGFDVLDNGDGTFTVGVKVVTDDVKENEATLVTKPQTATPDMTDTPSETKAKLNETITVGGETTTAAKEIEKKTEVEGVRLTTTSNIVEEVVIPAGVQAVVDVAKAKAVAAGNESFVTSVTSAEVIEVKVDVKVTPKKYEKPEDVATKKGEVSFDLDPRATVKVIKDGEEVAKEENVPVTNEMIDRNQKITVEIFTGFVPATILHEDESGKLIEAFSGPQISYDEVTGIAKVQVSHFSGLTAYEMPFVAKIGTTKYESLAAALAAVKAGETIELLCDLEETVDQVAPAVSFSLDLGAFNYANSGKLTNNGNVIVVGKGGNAFAFAQVVNVGSGAILLGYSGAVSSESFNGDLQAGVVGTPLTLTTSGFTARGDRLFRITDGSIVTFSGDGFNLNKDKNGDYMMIENAAEEKNSWDADGKLNHIGTTVNITNVTDAVNGFKAYSLYTNANSTNNIVDAALVKTEFINGYGGVFNVSKSHLQVDQTINLTGALSVEGGTATVSSVNIYAGYLPGYNGGKFTARDSVIDGSDRQVTVGNTRDKPKYYEKGGDTNAVLTLIRSTLKSSQLTNKGTVRMDAFSQIVLAPSVEDEFDGDYICAGGVIKVDMTGATAQYYKLIDYTGSKTKTLDDYSPVEFVNVGAYSFVVADNDLYAMKNLETGTLYVDDDWAGLADGAAPMPGIVIGGNGFATIPAAVNAADISAGVVTVRVAAGTYNDTVNLKNDHIKYTEGEETWYGKIHFIAEGEVVMNGAFTAGNDSVKNLGDIQISGFTFRNVCGATPGPVYLMNSSGIASNIVVTGNMIVYTDPTVGADAQPIYVNSGAVEDVVISDNTIIGADYYSISVGGADGTIDDVRICGNLLQKSADIGLFGRVLTGGVIVSNNTFDASSSGYALWVKNASGTASDGKITLADNSIVNGIKVVLRFRNKTAKADFVLGSGNTVDGVGITGWADTASDKYLVHANATANNAVYYDTKLYLGDETAFKSAVTAYNAATDAGTIVLMNGAKPVAVAKASFDMGTLLVGNGFKSMTQGSAYKHDGRTYYVGVNALGTATDLLSVMPGATTNVIAFGSAATIEGTFAVNQDLTLATADSAVNAALFEGLTVASGKKLTIAEGANLNGGTIANSGTLALKGSGTVESSTTSVKDTIANAGTILFDGFVTDLTAATPSVKLTEESGSRLVLTNGAMIVAGNLASSLAVDGTSQLTAADLTLGAGQIMEIGFSPDRPLIEAASVANAGGLILVDMTGATEENYKLIEATNPSAYGEMCVVRGDYVVRAIGNDLYAIHILGLTFEQSEGGEFTVSTNGGVIASGAPVPAGDIVSLAFTPSNTQWQIDTDSLQLKDATNGIYDVSYFSDVSLTGAKFAMPALSAELSVAFKISDIYREYLLAVANDQHVQAGDSIDALYMNRLTHGETESFFQDIYDVYTTAKNDLGEAYRPYEGDAVTNGLAASLAEIVAKAKAASDAKPYDLVIANDFTRAPFENIVTNVAGEVVAFTFEGLVYTNGVNAFNSFSEAATEESYVPFTTNVHVFGCQTIAEVPTMLFDWTLDLVTCETELGVTNAAIVTVAKTAADALVQIPEKLKAITGEGAIVLSVTNGTAGAAVYKAALEGLIGAADVSVAYANIESKRVKETGPKGMVDSQEVTVTDEVKPEEASEIVVPGVDTDGKVVIDVKPGVSNDVVVAGKLSSREWDVVIVNETTNTLTVGAIHAKLNVLITNVTDVGKILTLENVVAGKKIKIDNNGHLEANVYATDSLEIRNAAVNTLVGTYRSGGTIDITGVYGSLSNVVIDAMGQLTVSGTNVISGPVDLKSDTTVFAPGSRTDWSVVNDNHTLMIDFADVEQSPLFSVLIDGDQLTGALCGEYVLASNATSAVGREFSLLGPESFFRTLVVNGDVLYLGAKAFALSVNASDELVFSARYGKFAITYDAMGGMWSDGSIHSNLDAYVNQGYAFPAKDPVRENYTFAGWYRSWTNGAERVTETNVSVSAVLPLNGHSLWAKWNPVSSASTDKDIAVQDILNGQPVLAIEVGAYAQKAHPDQSFESFATPIYLRSIGDNAFQGAAALKKLVITEPRDYANASNQVMLTIGKQAFASCSGLEEIRISEGVTNIGLAAFMNCGNLKRIVFTGTQKITYGLKALYRCGYDNGTGALKVYMKQAFKDNNASLLTDLANWNTTISIVPIVDAFPVSGAPASISATDFGALGTDRKVAILVKVPMEIPGTRPSAASVAIRHSVALDGPWTILSPIASEANDDGTVLIEVRMPEGDSGYLKVELN